MGETVQMERENLRFQIRLLEQDAAARTHEQMSSEIARLEAENRNILAVESENSLLKSRLADAEASLSRLRTPSVGNKPSTGGQGEDGSGANPEDENDVMERLRWENSLLEKRLNSTRKYCDQLVGTAALPAPKKAPDARSLESELNALLARNEAGLRRLQGDVRPLTAAVEAAEVKDTPV